ncbi:MAG: DUF4340 domain-containing protein [Bacteroidota bacterium]
MNKNSLVLIAIVAILGIAAYLVLQRPGESSVSEETGQKLASYDSLAVDKIEIKAGSNYVVMEKQAGKWMIVQPISYPADQTAITTAIGKGATVLLTSLISSNPEKQGVFQVDSSAGTLVRIFEKGSEKAAFRIGKPGSTFTETYVREENSNDVYLANEMLTYTFNKQVKDWRDKTIFSAMSESIQSVSFQYGDTAFVLTRQDTTWKIDEAVAAATTMTSFLGSLSNFLSDDFVDSSLASPPQLIATIVVDGVQIRFHHENEAASYFVQTSRSPQWFSVQQWRVNQVLKRKRDFVGIAS